MDSITFEDFKKIEVRIGLVTKCEKVENADKLLKLQVDFGIDPKTNLPVVRQVVSAIAEFYMSEDLEGKKLPFIVNLEPRKFRGEESQGMLMAMDTEKKPVLLIPAEDVPLGTLIV